MARRNLSGAAGRTDSGAENADQDLLGDEVDQDLDADDEDADDDHDDDQDGDEDGSDDAGSGDAFDAEAFMQRVESRIDQRITGLMNRLTRRLDAAGGQGQQRQQSQRRQQAQPEVDAREARRVYREYIADELQFLDREERELATQLASGLIVEAIAGGAVDEDEIGAEVASKVAARIRKTRQSYSARTRQALRKQGLLPDPKAGQGGAEGRGKGPGMRSEMQKGAAIAAARYPKSS